MDERCIGTEGNTNTRESRSTEVCDTELRIADVGSNAAEGPPEQ